MTEEERDSLADSLEGFNVLTVSGQWPMIYIYGRNGHADFSLNQSPAKIKQAVTDMGLEPFAQ